MYRLAATAVALLLATTPVAAQMWDEPSFLGPSPADDLGGYAFRPDRGDWGFAAIWRQSGNVNLGVRAGVAGPAGGRLVLVGAELATPLQLFPAAGALRIMGTAGLGASFNGVTVLRVPVGLSAGFMMPLGANLSVTPYLHPRVALDLVSVEVGGQEQTDTEFNVPVDLGADVQFGESLVVRFGATLANVNVVGLGAAWRMPRRVAVR